MHLRLISKPKFFALQLQNLKNKEDSVKDEIRSDESKLFHVTKNLGKYSASIAEAHKKIEATSEKIRMLGSCPPNITKYQGARSGALYKELEDVNSALKAFDKVNRKSADQFAEICRKEAEFVETYEEINQSRERMRKVITDCNAKKDEAVQRSFEILQGEFEAIFKRLAPTGCAKLNLLKATESQKVVLFVNISSQHSS